MLIFRIIGGLAVIFFGSLFVIKTEWFMENIGAIEWAEQKFATSGGSRLFYKLIGVGICFIGLLIMTNMFRGFLIGTVGRLLLPPGTNPE
jgi:hypothetical protein